VHVAVGRITLRLPASHSLKDKRQVVKSVLARLQNQFNVSAAEVDENETWQLAVIGICCVSNNAAHAGRVLDEVISYVERSRPDTEIVEREQEVLSGL
jgi:uncharacterized protein YlxP (DUF503 family)